MVKLQFDKNKQYKITLPKVLVEALKWNKGDEIEINLGSKGELILKLKNKR